MRSFIGHFKYRIRIHISSWLSDHWRERFSPLYSVTDNVTEVPVQIAAYKLVCEKYLKPTDQVLDIGFGLGYGMEIMSSVTEHLVGVEIDRKAIAKVKALNQNNRLLEIIHYDGYHLPFSNKSFDVVTCIDVLEHVKDYSLLLENIYRISRRIVFISTPNRRQENTLPDGRPRNVWHLREWSAEEFHQVLEKSGVQRVEWYYMNGPWEGPFTYSSVIQTDTQALMPVLWIPQD